MARIQTVLTVVGTRPEAIKMAPVIHALNEDSGFRTILCTTGQHRHMLDQVLRVFKLVPNYELNIMKEGQTPLYVASAVLERLEPLLQKERPDWIFVQGDTTSAFAAAFAGYHHKVPIAHVEAGLRTHCKYHPFPEEINRKLIAGLADIHFAPTLSAQSNLIAEGVPPESIVVTGNTVVDALHRIVASPLPPDSVVRELRGRVVLVTVHRRENFGEPLRLICEAISKLHGLYGDITFVLPVHLNPAIRGYVRATLGGLARIRLLDPLDYPTFIHLMKRSCLVLSDSGGVQEEAPSLGVPVIILRDVTERPEAVESGWARLAGTSPANIIALASEVLECGAVKISPKENPFGDGTAAIRIRNWMKIGGSERQRYFDLGCGSGSITKVEVPSFD